MPNIMPHLYLNVTQFLIFTVFFFSSALLLSHRIDFIAALFLVVLYYVLFEVFTKNFNPSLHQSRKHDLVKKPNNKLDRLCMILMIIIYSTTYFSPFLLRNSPSITTLSIFDLVGIATFSLGALFSIGSALSNVGMSTYLKDSSDQKICISGTYRVCRHPFYFGQITMHLGFSIMVDMRLTILTVALFLTLAFRARIEEKYLEKFLTYKNYQSTCHSRIIWCVY